MDEEEKRVVSDMTTDVQDSTDINYVEKKVESSISEGVSSGMHIGIRTLTTIMLYLCIGAGVGYWLDIWLKSTPLFMLSGVLLGFTLSVIVIVRLEKKGSLDID